MNASRDDREKNRDGKAGRSANPTVPELLRGLNTKEVAQLAAEWIAARAQEAVARRGKFSLALSGGKSHWLMLAMLASVAEMPWEQTELFQVDERVASPGSPERNLTHLILTLPIEKQAALRPMPVTRRDLDQAAAEYEADLPERLDVVHLGLGPGGEVAGLDADDPAATDQARQVILTTPKGGEHRCMTLTMRAINEARSRLWLVTGEDRREPLARLLNADPSIPAGLVRRELSCVVADNTALGEASVSFAADLWRGPPES